MKTLIWDIEIFHDYSEDYQRRLYSGYVDTNVRMSADVSRISHLGFKWLDEGRASCIDLTEYKSFGKWDENEKDLLKDISELFAKADHLVAHYGDKFDRRYVNAKLLKYGLPPIPPAPLLKQSDTCKLARAHLKLSSNKLDNVARFLGVPMKRTKNWPGDWLKMTKKDFMAFKRVRHYCIGDVICLEEVYKKLRSFAKGIPNHSLEFEASCVNCGSSEYVKYGFSYVQKKKHQRFICQGCNSSFHEGQLVARGGEK